MEKSDKIGSKEQREQNMKAIKEQVKDTRKMVENGGIFKKGAVVFLAGSIIKAEDNNGKKGMEVEGAITGRGNDLLNVLVSVFKSDKDFRKLCSKAIAIAGGAENPFEMLKDLLKD